MKNEGVASCLTETGVKFNLGHNPYASALNSKPVVESKNFGGERDGAHNARAMEALQSDRFGSRRVGANRLTLGGMRRVPQAIAFRFGIYLGFAGA